MHLVAIAWMYVVSMMAAAEAAAPNGSWAGAAATWLLYGALPLSIVLYLMGSPMRRRARKPPDGPTAAGGAEHAGSAAQPHGSGEPSGDAVAPMREER